MSLKQDTTGLIDGTGGCTTTFEGASGELRELMLPEFNAVTSETSPSMRSGRY